MPRRPRGSKTDIKPVKELGDGLLLACQMLRRSHNCCPAAEVLSKNNNNNNNNNNNLESLLRSHVS